MQEQSIDTSDHSGLACRRGRNVLMLNELVMDLDILPCSPSADSWCTPYTQQMMSFSPPAEAAAVTVPQATREARHSSPATMPLANQMAGHNMMRTTPLMRSTDASQRSPAIARGLGVGLSGDASQRNPIGKVSLGVAVIGGDASQRSPPGCTNLMSPQKRSVPTPMQQTFVGSSMPDLSTPLTGTSPSPASPASSQSSTMQDASQRSAAGSAPTNIAVERCDVIKAWLSGVNGDGSPVSAVELAERLYAVAPESYED